MLWAVLPLKDFVNAKQRLSGVLAPHERRRLSQAMVGDVLTVLASHPAIDNTLIVSDDPSAELLAEHYGVAYWNEASLGVKGLNDVVSKIAANLQSKGIEQMLVVHGDLPLLSADEIQQMIDLHSNSEKPAITLVSDRHGKGSNCLLCSPPQAISFHYGEGSLHKHLLVAETNGVIADVITFDGASCDVDEAEDIHCLLGRYRASKTTIDKQTVNYLKSSGITRRLLAMHLDGVVDDETLEGEKVSL